jgi:hypothetical protein
METSRGSADTYADAVALVYDDIAKGKTSISSWPGGSISGSILMPGNVSGCVGGSFGSSLGPGVGGASLSIMRSFFPQKRRSNSSIPEGSAT